MAKAIASTSKENVGANPNTPAWFAETEGMTVKADAPPPSYPTIAYLNGNPQLLGNWRATGAFFVDGESDIKPQATPDGGTPWQPATFVNRKAEPVSGFAATYLHMTVIRLRRAWFIGQGKDAKRYPWGAFAAAKAANGNKNPRSKMQIIVAADGLPTLAALTLSGLQGADATARGGWGELSRRWLYDPAARMLADTLRKPCERMPSLAFKITIGGMERDGKPVYREAGSGNDTSIITPIGLVDPAGPVRDSDFGNYIIPRVLRESYERAYNEADPWVEAWSGNAQAEPVPVPTDGDYSEADDRGGDME